MRGIGPGMGRSRVSFADAAPCCLGEASLQKGHLCRGSILGSRPFHGALPGSCSAGLGGTLAPGGSPPHPGSTQLFLLSSGASEGPMAGWEGPESLPQRLGLSQLSLPQLLPLGSSMLGQIKNKTLIEFILS